MSGRVGMSASEIAGLNIDSRRDGQLHLAWAITGNSLRDFHKTKNRTRKIPLTNAINRVLDEAMEQKPADSIFIFLRKNGKPFRNREFREAWHEACAAAEIPFLVTYALRHCFVAYSEIMGIDRSRTVALMGHAGKSMIDRVYGKYTSMLERERRAIKEYYGEDFWGE